jgi:carboxypeptidase PM20D1
MVDEGGMILSDNPALPEFPTALINIQEKSYLTLTLAVMGEGGHSSTPPLVSTIGRLSAALAEIEQNPFPTRLVGPVESMLEVIGSHSGQPERFILENLWLTGGLVASQMTADRKTNAYVRTTTALTMFNAGVKENVVPQRAEAKINFRLLPGDTPEMVVRYVQGLIDDPVIEITYDSWNRAAPMADIQGSGFAVITEATLAVYPEVIVTPSLLPGATDTRHYIDLAENHYRYHGVMMNTEQSTGIHGTNEYISVESFDKSILIARQMIRLGSQ